MDDLLVRHARKEEIGCVDGLAVAKSLIALAVRYVNFYTASDVSQSRAAIGMLVVHALNEAHQEDGTFSDYNLPLTREGRKIPIKALMERLDVHHEAMLPRLGDLLEEARGLGLVGVRRRPLGPSRPGGA